MEYPDGLYKENKDEGLCWLIVFEDGVKFDWNNEVEDCLTYYHRHKGAPSTCGVFAKWMEDQTYVVNMLVPLEML